VALRSGFQAIRIDRDDALFRASEERAGDLLSFCSLRTTTSTRLVKSCAARAFASVTRRPRSSAITEAILTDLASTVSARVNQVNASVIAEERGLRVTEAKARAAQDFTSLVEVVVRNEQNESKVAGTLFGRAEQRIVTIDSYRLEAAPQGHMLVIRNDDQPGVSGASAPSWAITTSTSRSST